MTWTDDDTRALRAQGRCLDCAVDPALAHDHGAELEQRAAAEIRRLQARVAQLEREYECHPEGGVRGCDCWECLRVRNAVLEAERAEVAGVLRALGKKIRDAYTHADDLADGDAAIGSALEPIHNLTLGLSGVAARLERKDADDRD